MTTPNNDNRKVVAFHGGRRSIERLAAALADEYSGALFAVADRVYLLDEATGQLLIVNHDRLRELIAQRFTAVRLLMRDGRYEKDFFGLDLSRQDLTDILGEIGQLAPTGPSQMMTRTLTPMQKDHAVQRLRQGEPAASVAHAYATTVAEIQALRSAS
jgi:hypothetical protein